MQSEAFKKLEQGALELFKEFRTKTYGDATAICRATGKRWPDYWRRRRTKEYLQAAARRTGIPVEDLVNPGGTRVPRIVAMDLAQYCSPRFSVWFCSRLDEMLRTGQNREHYEAEIAEIFGEEVAARMCGLKTSPSSE